MKMVLIMQVSFQFHSKFLANFLTVKVVAIVVVVDDAYIVTFLLFIPPLIN